MEYILDVFILMIIIVGLCCALVTNDFAREVNNKIDREIK